MKGLSRVWGNLQARFLWGWSLVIGSGYETIPNNHLLLASQVSIDCNNLCKDVYNKLYK